jgi:hypothetical protein
VLPGGFGAAVAPVAVVDVAAAPAAAGFAADAGAAVAAAAGCAPAAGAPELVGAAVGAGGVWHATTPMSTAQSSQDVNVRDRDAFMLLPRR